MPTVAVVTTGGTIASRRDEDGVSRPVVAGPDLLATGADPAATEVHVTDVLSKDSSCLTFADMDRVRAAITAELSNPDIAGVVVLHGTDTMEETAFLVDLHHADRRPVVFTGAQRTFDHPESDAQANLSSAIAAATDPAMRGRGVLISFGGVLHSVPGVRKADTTALDAFRSVHSPTHRHRAEPLPWRPISGLRVDVVAVYPGADRVQLDACRSAGAHGLVLEALGSGNANPVIVEAVRESVAAGVPVAVSTRVPRGSIFPTYGGGGGGYDLAAAGALFSTDLRAGQARILLAALLADPDLDDLEKEFDRRSRIEP
ncbi:asparaginase [Rhodococcus tibetensis]|uniref:asparaginase n=1 Tax=Rhodococcus tibetensis TaxID=2965064 RepID=A0ABT1Q5Q9_9NOCA|nr:asparaginase [Rhodococcus sp. FXJ9.536]MCQ4117586.1 asparaginase [Rhodococcus sp. FXJ9.536]